MGFDRYASGWLQDSKNWYKNQFFVGEIWPTRWAYHAKKSSWHILLILYSSPSMVHPIFENFDSKIVVVSLRMWLPLFCPRLSGAVLAQGPWTQCYKLSPQPAVPNSRGLKSTGYRIYLIVSVYISLFIQGIPRVANYCYFIYYFVFHMHPLHWFFCFFLYSFHIWSVIVVFMYLCVIHCFISLVIFCFVFGSWYGKGTRKSDFDFFFNLRVFIKE